MKYIYEMSALRIYSKAERMTFKEMADEIGINPNTMARYAGGSRLPNLQTLLHICNTLRVSVGAFIHNPDIEPVSVQVFPREEFVPVKFRFGRIEQFRQEKQMDRKPLLDLIREATGEQVNHVTYARLLEGLPVGASLPVAFLNTFNFHLSYLFDDRQLIGQKEVCGEGNVIVPRSFIDGMKERIRSLEDENRRLYTENKRVKTREHARYVGTSMEVHAEREMRTFIRKAERALDDLKSYLSGEGKGEDAGL